MTCLGIDCKEVLFFVFKKKKVMGSLPDTFQIQPWLLNHSEMMQGKRNIKDTACFGIAIKQTIRAAAVLLENESSRAI